MTHRLIGAVLAKNEAGRFLRPVLARLREVCDQVLVLDDHSTDDTPGIAGQLGCLVRVRQSPVDAWGNESSARQELWDLAVQACGPEDWVLVCDADQVLVGDPRPLMQSWEANSVALRLYDCWGEGVYRCDTFWQGHTMPRVWMVAPYRVPPDWVAAWSPRGIHCGHLPLNWPIIGQLHDPALYWLHLSYSTPTLRRAKHAQYVAQADQLSEFEAAHAASILDS